MSSMDWSAAISDTSAGRRNDTSLLVDGETTDKKTPAMHVSVLTLTQGMV